MNSPHATLGPARSSARGPGWIGTGLLLAAGAALGWWLHELGSARGEAEGAEEAAQLVPEETRVHVEVACVARGEFSIVLPAVGSVLAEPSATWTIASRAGGRVLEAPIAAGQWVEKGALLVRFDRSPLALALETARAARARAANTLEIFEAGGSEQRTKELEAAAQRDRSELDLAETSRARLEPLLEQGLVSERAVQEARQIEEQARAEHASSLAGLAAWTERGAELERASLAAELAAAEAALTDAAAVLAEAEVRAPAPGHVADFRARTGEHVDPGADLGTLVLGAGRRLVFGVAPRSASAVRDQGRVWWTDAAGTSRTGRVTGRAPEIEADTGLILVSVTPDAPDSGEPLGALVRGEIELEHLADVTLVPERAVLRSDDRPAVVVVDAGERARTVPVRLLGRRLGQAGVEGPIAAGDRVVIAGGYNLPDGARVVIGTGVPVEPPAPAPEPGEGR